MKNFLKILLIAITFQISYAQNNIIPKPVNFNLTKDHFEINRGVVFDIRTKDKEVINYTNHFENLLKEKGIQISPKTKKNNAGSIIITLLEAINDELGTEGYLLDIKKDKILLSANKASGIFNGLQSLRQLFPSEFEKNEQTLTSLTLNGCEIKDYPRFNWRGLHLDVSRHFFTVDEVKAFIDKMSQYKFNVFHWHLTDDEGWRIEIKSLPKLTEVGAWRVERYGDFGKERPYPKPGEKATYGGFYTQEEIKDVVQYALNRNITIVPEIDMPGHSMAALAAYPELSTKQESKFVNPGSKFSEWYGNGTFKMLIENTLNPADEQVYEFVDKVFTEVAQLFPGDFIHMGGDECYKGFWEEDEKVQLFMKENNLSNSEELQSYFVKRVEKIIQSKGKKLIGWDEILEGGLAEDATVMSWRGMKGGIEAAKLGHHVVMTPTTYSYLDYTQGDHSVENVIYNDLSLETCYSFEPVPENTDPKYILGGQGNVWTEKIPTMPFAFYMTYPRAFALSETLWSPKELKNWNDFIPRVEEHFTRFDNAHLNISKAVLDPIINVYIKDDQLLCELKNSIPDTEIFYTINNTYPVKFGLKYNEPFVIPEGNLSLRTQTFRNGMPIGRALKIHRSELVKRSGK
ncbi:family 20 glycosylhydrolase [Gaetbulibacter aquiaggeris]|uniref:beta-N-acetylhexosaminidase n=1 Tax=Gaetbulibacter aquiaggeris TaxID=1735373 RepID=A0ABW7MQ77_9FLAO